MLTSYFNCRKSYIASRSTHSASQPPLLTGQQVPIPLDHWGDLCVPYLLLLISDDGVYKQHLLVTSIAGNLTLPFLPPVDSTLDVYKTI